MKKKVNRRVPLWVAVVLDESGSMYGVRTKTISGFNEYLQDRKKDAEEVPTRFWLTKFNTESTVVFNGEDVEEVPSLFNNSYHPTGGTALYDAVAQTIHSIAANLDSEEVTPKVLVMIITDGEENASKFTTKDSIFSLIKSKETEGNWTFTYMGAGKDAWANSQAMGIYSANTVMYNNYAPEVAFRGASKGATSRAYGQQMNSISLCAVDGVIATTAEEMANAIVDLSTGELTSKTKKKK